MEELRLPWSRKEGILFGCIIAFISSNLIGGYNVYFNMGYELGEFGDFLTTWLKLQPIMFVTAFTLSNTVFGWISARVVRRFMAPTDSTNTCLCFNLIVCVLLMSVSLTFLGGAAGQLVGWLDGGPGIDLYGLLDNWPRIWPRNFCIAFWVEMLVAQPAARRVMMGIHRRRITSSEASECTS